MMVYGGYGSGVQVVRVRVVDHGRVTMVVTVGVRQLTMMIQVGATVRSGAVTVRYGRCRVQVGGDSCDRYHGGAVMGGCGVRARCTGAGGGGGCGCGGGGGGGWVGGGGGVGWRVVVGLERQAWVCDGDDDDDERFDDG